MTNIDNRIRLALAFALMTTVSAQNRAHANPSADEHGDAGASAPQAPTPLYAAPPTAALRYSMPWQLRPLTVGNVVRLDGVAAVFNDDNGNLDVAVASILSATYELTPNWAPIVRLGFVGNNAPGAALDGSSFVNPVTGIAYTRYMGSSGLAFFGATTIPVGMGGGNVPRVGAEKTNAAASTVRPADDAMFAVNYLAEILGIDFSYVGHGLTTQGEATLVQYVRVRGDHSATATDRFRTRAALGLHLGYFINSYFSLGGELHYQRWLSHPTTLNPTTEAHAPLSEANMDTFTVAGGPRLHFRLGTQTWLRPGIAIVRGLGARGFNAPLITAQTTAVQVDVPLTF